MGLNTYKKSLSSPLPLLFLLVLMLCVTPAIPLPVAVTPVISAPLPSAAAPVSPSPLPHGVEHSNYDHGHEEGGHRRMAARSAHRDPAGSTDTVITHASGAASYGPSTLQQRELESPAAGYRIVCDDMVPSRAARMSPPRSLSDKRGDPCLLAADDGSMWCDDGGQLTTSLLPSALDLDPCLERCFCMGMVPRIAGAGAGAEASGDVGIPPDIEEKDDKGAIPTSSAHHSRRQGGGGGGGFAFELQCASVETRRYCETVSTCPADGMLSTGDGMCADQCNCVCADCSDGGWSPFPLREGRGG